MRPGLRLSLLLSGLTLLMAVSAVSAQSGPAIERLKISLWPEYDQPRMLVIYDVQLAEDTLLPTQVSLLIPVEVGEPYAVAMQGPEGDLLVAPYQRQVEGAWALITVTSDSQVVQIEYYADLQFDGATRSFAFEWPAFVALGELVFEVQQPVDSSQVIVEPAATDIFLAANGLTYQRGSLGRRAAGERAEIRVEYQKESDRLSSDALPAAPSIGRPQDTQGETPDLAALLPWLVGAFAALVLVFGAWMYVRSTREAAGHGRRPRHRAARQDSPSEDGGLPVFCHQCGAGAGAGDRYCRHCGTPLRR
jgi:hypothetical protein